ncbi:hypothetical protein [uncultured Hyphomicrobium sp.]|uniref:hypothetical protein n=1 Tax=uncultured Hyphomicrobium sp. TaxID=194373 RepID=UPI0025FB5ABA|nr:hypothetical protein [uncultured Hyphomicrobium sp.]
MTLLINPMHSADKPKYPDITVELTGSDGNAFAVLGKVRKALRQAGLRDDEIKKFSDEAMAGDYDHLLRTCMRWVNVD